MQLNKFAVALVSMIAVLFLSGCETFRNVSKSDLHFKNRIDKSICTNGPLHLTRWSASAVRYPELQEFVLYEGKIRVRKAPVKTLKDFTIPSGESHRSIPVPKGTRLTIEEVYYYDAISHLGYIVVASVSDLPVGTKSIEISRIFDTNSPYELLSEYGEYC